MLPHFLAHAAQRAGRACLALIAMAYCAGPVVAQPTAQPTAHPPTEAPLDLKFSSFFQQPVGPRGLEISQALRAADGRQVRLVGYMVAQESPAPGRFMLTPRPVRMSEHADGEADDLPPATVTVLLDDAQRDRIVPHRPGLVALVGRLSVGREEDAAGRVSWVRLILPGTALADSPLVARPATPSAH